VRKYQVAGMTASAPSRVLYPEKEKCHVENEYFDRHTVGNYIPGVDQFSALGQYFIYFRAVHSVAIGGDFVAHQ
jgi:hypothetical protein